MYITLQSINRKLGLFGLEYLDLVIGAIFGILFTIFFILGIYQVGILFALIGIFLLIPMNFSNKNRLYKVLILFSRYLFRNKEYVLFKNIEETRFVNFEKFKKYF